MASKTDTKSKLSPDLEEKLALELKKIKDKAQKDGLTKEEIKELFLNYVKTRTKSSSKGYKICLVFLVPVLLGFVGFLFTDFTSLHEIREGFYSSKCLIDNNAILMEIARPIADCSMCKGLKEVPIVYDLTEKEFIEKYAYTAVPALVKDGTINWTAMETFSYSWLKELYTRTPDALKSVEDECQFFPYNTEFHTLADAFKMSDARASFQEGEDNWYIGWSNCHGDTADVLRKHYKRPHFLPNDSESSALDWIFMGGSGPGANVHLDYVQRPSWQAQISGKKSWMLIPVPECEHVCHTLNVTVSKGDIILLDTNQWYHSTFVHPGEISIVIGSEYD